MNRATGLLIIEVINSNPNGDPDQESDPRLRPDERGMISPVSFKRKLRDLVQDKDGPVWQALASSFDPPLQAGSYCILESRGRDRRAIETEISNGEFVNKYWDARIFGNTFLEEGASTSIRTGVVQFGMGVSVSPVEVQRLTNTNKAGVEADKDRGMAPLAYRIVLHGVYVMPFFVNPTAAQKSGCTDLDIDLMKKLIPFAYSHTASYVRPMVTIRHAWYAEHRSPLGSCPDFELIEALTPRRIPEQDKEIPSKTWEDYSVPTSLPDPLLSRLNKLEDLAAVS